jgi:hypothetical protein
MDYLFFSSIKGTALTRLVSSYDIVCQWHIYLWERMLDFPDELHFDHSNKKVTFLVPKFHLPAHVAACQTAFSFNLTRGVGRTDGEAPERGWADINPLSAQTKQMGPASRRETIDDHFNDWNHKKVIGLGTFTFIKSPSIAWLIDGLLGTRQLRKIQIAGPDRSVHVSEFMEFTKSLPADTVLEWSEMVEKWELNDEEVNPYVPTVKSK